MKTVSNRLRHWTCQRPLKLSQWQRRQQPLTAAFANLTLGSTRHQSTSTTSSAPSSAHNVVTETLSMLEKAKMPFQGLEEVRRTPISPSYFSRETNFNDHYIRLLKLYARYSHLPVVRPSEAPFRVWLKFKDARSVGGEVIKAAHYANAMKVAKRLHLIPKSLRPLEIDEALQRFTKRDDQFQTEVKTLRPDVKGRIVATGKRKESTVRAFVIEGDGEILVNGKNLAEAFPRVHDRESAIWALTSTQRLDKYNVWVLAEGGGTTGQAEAMTLAVAKALLGFEPALKPALRKAGCVTRDPRVVERKHHGHRKARKSPAWVKR